MNALQQTASFVAITKDWLGDGMQPVSRDLAEARAIVCAACPLNSHGTWWEISKDAVAEAIRRYIHFKNHIAVRVSNEDRLFMCSACGCATRLKVHVPIEHIKKNTTPEVMAKLDPNCWIRKEIT